MLLEIEDLATRALAKAWGDIPRAPWIRVAFFATPDPVMSTTRLDVQVEVDEHDVTCRLWRGKVFRREGGRIKAATTIPHQDLMADDAHRLVANHASKTLRFASGLLREYDPRIGTIVSEVREFPRGVLFDPPRMRPFKSDKSVLDAMDCPVCHKGFGAGSPAMWAGGNLLWTHPACWLRIHSDD